MLRRFFGRADSTLFVLIGIGVAILATTEAAGQAIPPSMSAARGAHTATLLASGKVLVAGGNDANGRVANAEVYDPASNAWTPASHLTTPRFFHTATLLANGKVLVAGGTNGDFLGSAELYDPATNTWTGTGSMMTPRMQHSATALPNGKVLIVGGNTATGATASVEIYDPATGNWAIATGLTTARYAHTATLLASGRVLVAGGQNQSGPSATVEVYDPASNTWTVAAKLATPRNDHTAILLPNGNVLVVGGDSGSASLTSAERYDPVGNVWTAAGALSVPRKFHTMTRLPSGKIMITGGYTGTQDSALVEQYDPTANTWSTSPNLATGRWGHSATLLASGKLLIAGGYSQAKGYLATTELYSPTNLGSLLTPRTAHTATLLSNGSVLIAGGTDSNGVATASAEIFNPTTGVSTAYTSMFAARSGHFAIASPFGGGVIIIGGTGTSLAEAYSPPGWSLLAPAPRTFSTSTDSVVTLADSRIIFLAALGLGSNLPLSGTTIYDPGLNAWSSSGAGFGWSATHSPGALLASGKAWFSGGSGTPLFFAGPPFSFTPTEAATGLYDPKLSAHNCVESVPTCASLTPTANLPTERQGHLALTLTNGKVLIAGGGDHPLGSNYYVPGAPLLYDPVADRYSAATNFPPAPTQLPALPVSYLLALLPSGKVLHLFDTHAEIYDPAANSWTTAPDLATSRSAYTATVLRSGKVLIIGGKSSAGMVREIELYDAQTITTVQAIEFYNAGQDHYFVSSLAADITALDSGLYKGWTRTGQSFNAYPVAEPGASPVCRFYIPPAQGDSHFYSASPTECAQVTAKFPTFILESSNVMYMGLPDPSTGACASGWTPVYRLWDGRGDSNHRYTTDRTTRNQMVAKGWVAEGYGPDPVIMCAPP